MNKIISLRMRIFHKIAICCLGKTFSSTPDGAKVEDLAKASVTENNLFCY